MKTFKLKRALVHYGASSYPLHGLPEKFNEIDLIDGENILPALANDLTVEVGQITSFIREFTAKHIPEQVLGLPAGPLVIPEHIYASANGYSLLWEKVT